MKMSEVTINDLMEYAREYSEEPEVIRSFSIILPAVKSYIKSYTGLSDEEIDAKEEITISLFVLANEMYDNRTYTVDNDKVNKVIKSILDMHSVNCL